MPRFPVRRVLLYQSLKMIKNKDPPRENPSPRKKEAPSNMPRPRRMRGLHLVDSWSSRPGPRAVGRLTQVFGGRGAKRGDLRGASRVRAGRGRCPRWGGPFHPFSRARAVFRTGTNFASLQKGQYVVLKCGTRCPTPCAVHNCARS